MEDVPKAIAEGPAEVDEVQEEISKIIKKKDSSRADRREKVKV